LSATDDQLASRSAGLVYFVKLEFTTGTAYLCTWNHSIDWDGHTWAGLGALSVSTVTNTDQLEYPPMEVMLNVADPAMLALARGQVDTYRRRPVTLYKMVYDEQLVPVGPPEQEWYGLMDQVRIKMTDGTTEPSAVVLRCENPSRDSRSVQSLRLNHAQHIQRHPGDTFLQRIEALVGKPQPWLSKKFQEAS